MILDSHIVLSASEVNARELFDAFRRLYPDMAFNDEDDLEAIEAWLVKFCERSVNIGKNPLRQLGFVLNTWEKISNFMGMDWHQHR